MTVDEKLRAAVDELHTTITGDLDHEAGLADLRRRRHRRTRSAWVAAAAGAAAVALLVAVASTVGPRDPDPAPVVPGPDPEIEHVESGWRNGSLVAGDGMLRSAEPAPTLPRTMDGPYRAFSTDGRLLAYTHGRQVRVRDVTTGADHEITRCRSNVCSASWSPDGSTLAVADYNTITAYDVRSGDGSVLLRDFRFIFDLAWSPDGRTIAFRGTGVEGDALRLLDVDSGRFIRMYSARTGRVAAGPSWAPDGRTLAFVEFTPDDDRLVDVTAMTVEPEEYADPVPLAPSQCPCVAGWPSLAWSPDGRSVTVNSAFGSGEPVDSVDVLGRRVTVEYLGGAGLLAWQPLPSR